MQHSKVELAAPSCISSDHVLVKLLMVCWNYTHLRLANFALQCPCEGALTLSFAATCALVYLPRTGQCRQPSLADSTSELFVSVSLFFATRLFDSTQARLFDWLNPVLECVIMSTLLNSIQSRPAVCLS